MAFDGEDGLEWSDDTSLLSFDFIDDFSEDSSLFDENSVNGGENELHEFSIGVETLDDIEKGVDDGFGVVVDFLSLDGFVLLCDSEEVFDGFGFKKFLVFLEVVETHFDSSGDFTEGFFLHVEAHGVMVVAFSLGFHTIP